MICRTCGGSGTILSRGWPLEFWGCPACGGAGVRILYAPPTVGPKPKKAKR